MKSAAKVREADQSPPPSFSAWQKKMAQALGEVLPNVPAVVVPSAASTNKDAKAAALAGASEWSCYVAREQTDGRGQHGRRWQSTAGLGLYLSVLLRPPWSARDAVHLALLGAVAMARGLEDLGLRELSVKWPNDVRARERKIGGVLVESRLQRGVIDFAVVGFGVNVLHREQDFAVELRPSATSCRMEGNGADEAAVAAALLRRLKEEYARIAPGHFEPLVRQWTRFGGTMRI